MHQHSDIGDRVMFICPLDSAVSWYHERFSHHPVSKPISNERNLLLGITSALFSGKYFCVGTFKNSTKNIISKADLYVHGW